MTGTRPAFRKWLRALAALTLAACLAPAFGQDSGSSGTLPLWRATDGAGHVLYLVGSMHALTASDYPLPAPMTEAFKSSGRLVEEIDLADVTPDDVAAAALRLGTLSDSTLQKTMDGDWPEAQRLAAKAKINLKQYSNLKPWLAAVEIADVVLVRAGYNPELGLDIHFAREAATRNMPVTGLETIDEQLGLLDDMDPALQRHFLLQTLEEAPLASTELDALHAAWRSGSGKALEAIEQRDFSDFPQLRQRLLVDRNRQWLPAIRKCLSSGTTCFVTVGIEHMVGPHGLVTLLRDSGVDVEQVKAPATAGRAATAAAPASGRG